MAHILYLHQYFRTPAQGGAIRSYHFAKALVLAGHQVSLITTHNAADYRCVVIDGISVHYLPVYYANELSFWRRVHSFMRYFIAAYRLARRIKADVVYASSTPLTVGVLALCLHLRQGTPYYFELRDWWPEVPVRLGIIRNTLLIRCLYFLEERIYRYARRIVVLNPQVARRLAPHHRSKITLIPNMADVEMFAPSISPARPFRVAYFGTLGYANHLEYLVEIARYGQDRGYTDVEFLLIGEGAQAPHLAQLIARYDLRNINLHRAVSKEALRELLADTQAAYISFLSNPVLQTTSPNKFFDALAMGKLCIVNTDGWLRKLVVQHECGFYAPPDSPALFWERLERYLGQPSRLHHAQVRARRVAERYFSVRLLTARLLDLFV